MSTLVLPQLKATTVKLMHDHDIDVIEQLWLESSQRECITGCNADRLTMYVAVFSYDPYGIPNEIDDIRKKVEIMDEAVAKSTVPDRYGFVDVWSWTLLEVMTTLSEDDKYFKVKTKITSFLDTTKH